MSIALLEIGWMARGDFRYNFLLLLSSCCVTCIWESGVTWLSCNHQSVFATFQWAWTSVCSIAGLLFEYMTYDKYSLNAWSEFMMMAAVSSSENEVCRVQQEVKQHQPTSVDLQRR